MNYLSVNDLDVNDPGVNYLSVNDPGVNDLSVNDLGVSDLSVDDLGVNDLSVDDLCVNDQYLQSFHFLYFQMFFHRHRVKDTTHAREDLHFVIATWNNNCSECPSLRSNMSTTFHLQHSTPSTIYHPPLPYLTYTLRPHNLDVSFTILLVEYIQIPRG